MSQGMNAYDEHGITQTVEAIVGQPETDAADSLACDVDAVLAMHNAVWQWVYQPPLADLDGFMCRAIIAAWVFCPQLRSYTQTEIAGRFGKKKQSLNRWIVSFKREFSDISNHLPHIKHESRHTRSH